jgi:hypothetical protein
VLLIDDAIERPEPGLEAFLDFALVAGIFLAVI